MRRQAALLFTSMLASPTLGGCAYLFPSCASVPSCPAGQAPCNMLTCSDLRTDPFNCGFCNNACGAGLACVPDGGPNGGAACGCPIPGQILAGGECLDLAVDPDNCGAIGKACRQDQACIDGGCGCPFPTYLDGGSGECSTDAGQTCTDFLNDPENCGGCGLVCAGGCALGSCDGGMTDGGPVDAGLADAGDGG